MVYYYDILNAQRVRVKPVRPYMQATGTALEGTLEEQNALFDKVARRYRAYSDYREHRSVARFRHECEKGPVGMGPLPEYLTATREESMSACERWRRRV